MMERFAAVCEQVSATRKRLKKEQIVSEYLRTLDDAELALACTFLSGRPFPLKDSRTLNAGYAMVRDAIQELNPDAPDLLPDLLRRTGDAGEAVQELFKGKLVSPTLHLKDVFRYFEQLAETSVQSEKREQTRRLLSLTTPVECKYILKILLGGMRIGMQESLVESSIAKAFEQSLTDVQYANMLLGDIGECAVLARHNRLGKARMRLLHPIKVMLASPEEDVEKLLQYMDGEGWAEDKYDGIRAQIHKEGGKIRIFSRDLEDVTHSFPEVVESVSQLNTSFLLDGEIVPVKKGNILEFGELQKRLGRKRLAKEILDAVPCRYFAFDLLYLEGVTFFSLPLKERREKLVDLQKLAPEAFEITRRKEVRTVADVESAFRTARERNNEGLVVKHPESVYAPGKRGKQWLKLKRALVTLDVVVVAAEYGHGKRKGLLSDYTFAVQQEGKLLTIGKAYSGITDPELNKLSELFHQLSIRSNAFRHEVQPQVVLEIAFDRINRSNRHTSGFALRFPRIRRIRWDKKPADIDTVETVEHYFNAQKS